MKTLTVEIPENDFARAARRAVGQGTTLEQKVAHLVREYGNDSPRPTPDLAALFAALDKARNSTPIGSLCREQLYDRDILR